MKAKRYLRVDKREFLMEVLVIRLVKLLRELFALFFYIWGMFKLNVVPAGHLLRSRGISNFIAGVGIPTVALN